MAFSEISCCGEFKLNNFIFAQEVYYNNMHTLCLYGQHGQHRSPASMPGRARIGPKSYSDHKKTILFSNHLKKAWSVESYLFCV